MSTAPSELLNSALAPHAGVEPASNPTPAETPAIARPTPRLSLWRRFLAATRLSRTAVCEVSAGLGEYDYHNHTDDATGAPWHIEGGRRCARCGKRFRV